MDLYEYQGKQLFARFGIPVSDGRVAFTPEEARAAAAEIGGPVVVKAQVLVGGRGKAGGIKLATTPDEAAERASEILGLDIRGHVVRTLWIEQRIGHRARVLLLDHVRPRRQAAAVHAHDERRRRHRGGRGERPRRARAACTSTRSPAGIPGSRASSAFAPGIPADERKQVMAIIEASYRAFRECRRDARRDQPADRHARAARCARSTPSSRSTTTRCTGTPTSPRCATSRRPIRRSRWRARRA